MRAPGVLTLGVGEGAAAFSLGSERIDHCESATIWNGVRSLQQFHSACESKTRLWLTALPVEDGLAIAARPALPAPRKHVAGLAGEPFGAHLGGVTGFVIAFRRKRYLPVGWFWFLGTLVPVLGLVQVGDAAMRIATPTSR